MFIAGGDAHVPKKLRAGTPTYLNGFPTMLMTKEQHIILNILTQVHPLLNLTILS